MMTPYKAGYDCAITHPTLENCDARLFSTFAFLRQWEEGFQAGKASLTTAVVSRDGKTYRVTGVHDAEDLLRALMGSKP